MTATETPEVVDLDRLEAEVRENITRLQEAAGRLSLDAIGGDSELRAELENIEHEITAARAELGRIDQARGEQERRASERQQHERDARQAAALDEARRFQGERQAAARKIDQHAKALMGAIEAYVSACSDQQRAFTEAGLPSASSAARPKGWVLDAALIHAKRQVRLPDEFLQGLPAISPQHVGPAAERDPNLADAYLGKE